MQQPKQREHGRDDDSPGGCKDKITRAGRLCSRSRGLAPGCYPQTTHATRSPRATIASLQERCQPHPKLRDASASGELHLDEPRMVVASCSRYRIQIDRAWHLPAKHREIRQETQLGYDEGQTVHCCAINRSEWFRRRCSSEGMAARRQPVQQMLV